MLLIVLLVFIAVFAVFVLLTAAVAKPKTPRQLEATLASALGFSRFSEREEIIDVRKERRLSAIPWLHHLLSRVNVSLELRLLITQADLTWTTGRLMLISVAAWLLSSFLIGLRFQSIIAGPLLGLVVGAAPFGYVLWKRARRLKQIQEQVPDTLDLMVSSPACGPQYGQRTRRSGKRGPRADRPRVSPLFRRAELRYQPAHGDK